VTDRLLHHSTVVSIQGEGYRLKDKVVFLILGVRRNSIGASVVSSPISRDAARRPSADGYAASLSEGRDTFPDF
jgi:IstB-like ATP binding protein